MKSALMMLASPYEESDVKDQKAHWEEIYAQKNPDEVSWYQRHPSISLQMIEATNIENDAWIIDVGGGASTLVDHLLDKGHTKLAVLDISSSALQRDQERLGENASRIEWIESDVRSFRPEHQYALWHDRAVFHFLTDEADRQSYLRALEVTLAPHGHFIISTFAIGGPQKCSGLDIVQYDEASLSQFFNDSFELKESRTEAHHTPWNTEQKFIYSRFLRKGRTNEPSHR
jgi:ubiquinone/menaquinone biosynthesis C-methylase UbiE